MKLTLMCLIFLIGCSGTQKTFDEYSDLTVLEKPLIIDTDGNGFDRLTTVSFIPMEFTKKILSSDSYYGLIRGRGFKQSPVLLIYNNEGKNVDSLVLFPNGGVCTIYPPMGGSNNAMCKRDKAEFINDSTINLITEVLSRRFDDVRGKPDTSRDVTEEVFVEKIIISKRGKVKHIDSLQVDSN
jgi:hypothetical protein